MENPTELLSNIDIEELCKMFKINLVFCGFKAKLNNLRVIPGSYVINLDEINSQGSHWVCFYINNKFCVYFDSFGEEPPLEVINFCRKSNIKLMSNYFKIQDINGTECGWYCIAFLYWMNKYKNVNQYILNMFNKQFDTENTKNNKSILQKYIKSINL